MGGCSISGCPSQVAIKKWGLCNRHYMRLKRHGHPESGGARHYSSDEAAFEARTHKDGDCLVWDGAKGSNGYGAITVSGRRALAHRYSWERANGPIPEGMWIDHTCYRRDCVNPDHLRLATAQQNSQNLQGPQRGRDLPRGVYLDRRTGRYYAQVQCGGKTHTNGGHATAQSAQMAAESMRAELFGQFAGKG